MTDTAPVEATAKSPFERIGGHAVLRAITDRFYDLMEQDPAYAELRAMHAANLSAMRASLPSFLAGWAGGPRDWFEQNPGKCMMSAHASFPITPVTARQWVAAMRRAIADTRTTDPEIAEAMGDVLERMALGMARSAS